MYEQRKNANAKPYSTVLYCTVYLIDPRDDTTCAFADTRRNGDEYKAYILCEMNDTSLYAQYILERKEIFNWNSEM